MRNINVCLCIFVLASCGTDSRFDGDVPEFATESAALSRDWSPILRCDVDNRVVVDADKNDPETVQIVVKNPDIIRYLRSNAFDQGALYDEGRTLVFGPRKRTDVFGSDFFTTRVSAPARDRTGHLLWRTPGDDASPFGRQERWRVGGCTYDLSVFGPVQLVSEDPDMSPEVRCNGAIIYTLRNDAETRLGIEITDPAAIAAFSARGALTKRGIFSFRNDGYSRPAGFVIEGSGKFLTNTTDPSFQRQPASIAADVFAEQNGDLRVSLWDGAHTDWTFTGCNY